MTKLRARAIAASPALSLRTMFRWSGLALVAVTALTLAGQARSETNIKSHGYSNFGELKYPADFERLEYVNPDAPKGGEFSTWALGTFDSFNPYARDGVPAQGGSIGTEAILTATADDAYGMYCFLCTTMEYDEDLSYVIFNLREDVTFSDGRPMTAADVEFSFNLILEQAIPEYRLVRATWIDTVTVLDPYKIKFTFTDEAPKRDRVGFAGGTPVWSKAWFEETGSRLDKSAREPFMTTGPYVLESVDINRNVSYRRNPDYWGNDLPFNVGRNNFDVIRYEYFTDRTAAFEAFKTGAYLFRSESDAKEWATGYEFPGVKDGTVKQEAIPDETVGQALSFVFNLSREKWQDKRVRDAVSMMFNFEWSNKTLFYNLFDRPTSFWPNTPLAASGPPSPAELEILQPLVDQGLLDAGILTEDAFVWPQEDADSNRPSRKSMRAASKMLEEAGWVIGDDGKRRKNGEILSVNIIQFNPLYDRVVNPFIENLKAIGLDANLERIDTAQYVERRRKGDFDMTNQGFQMSFEPSTALKQWFGSETAESSSRNLMRLKNDAVDAILPGIISADTLDGLTSGVHALDRVLRSIGFSVPQWYNKDSWLAYFDIYRHPENMPPLALGVLDFWWYDAEAAAELRSAGKLR